MCGGMWLRCARFGTAACKGISALKGGGGDGGGGAETAREGEKDRERLSLHYSLPAFTVLYNSRGERRWGDGREGVADGEKNALFNLICYLQGRYRCPRSGLCVPGRYK